MSIIEHRPTGDPYTSECVWMLSESKHEFAANAVWRKHVRRDGPFDGPSYQKLTTRILSAESDDIEELRSWGRAQKDLGAEWVSIYRTWEMNFPKGHYLHGKRDNEFAEGF